MATSYLDLLADLAAGKEFTYGDLDQAVKNHAKSAISDGFVRHTKRLLSDAGSKISLTESGRTYVAALQAAGLIVAAQPKAEKVGRHAKPKASAKPRTTKTTTRRSRKASPVTTKKVQPKAVPAMVIPTPAELERMRQAAESYSAVINFLGMFPATSTK